MDGSRKSRRDDKAGTSQNETSLLGFSADSDEVGDPRDPVYAEYQRALLREAFGDPVPAATLQMWARLTPDRRSTATARLVAMLAWDAAERKKERTSPQKVAEKLGLSVNRVYRMRRAWKGSPTLAALGAFAGSPLKRTGQYGEAVFAVLRAAASDLLQLETRPGIEDIVVALRKDFASLGDDLPAISTLRTIIHEARRGLPPRDVGKSLALDYTALNASDPNGVVHTAFFALDPENGLIFGFSLGEPAASRLAYARSATSALRTVHQLAVPWSERLDDFRIVVGTDRSEWQFLPFNIRDFLSSPRPGQAIGRATGGRLETIRVIPRATPGVGHTTSEDLPILTDAEMTELLRIEVERHNSAIEKRALGVSKSVPENLVTVLRIIEGD